MYKIALHFQYGFPIFELVLHSRWATYCNATKQVIASARKGVRQPAIQEFQEC